jgi:simple sugar transport system ATP-binding protein
MTDAAPAVLAVERISMSFGRVVALNDVSLTVPGGSVTCLLGDNGAGKTTLIRVLSGVHQPSSGRCLVDGRVVRFRSPRDAIAAGIATVHQDLALIPLMSVWRNFFLGAEPVVGAGPFRRIDVARCRDDARTALARLGIDMPDCDRHLGTLSGGERQAVAIARAVHFGARVLILDEPTAALGVRQTRVVLDVIAQTRDRGIAVVFITHNPHHAIMVGDTFTVLRRGRTVAPFARGDVSAERLAELMSGD